MDSAAGSSRSPGLFSTFGAPWLFSGPQFFRSDRGRSPHGATGPRGIARPPDDPAVLRHLLTRHLVGFDDIGVRRLETAGADVLVAPDDEASGVERNAADRSFSQIGQVTAKDLLRGLRPSADLRLEKPRRMAQLPKLGDPASKQGRKTGLLPPAKSLPAPGARRSHATRVPR